VLVTVGVELHWAKLVTALTVTLKLDWATPRTKPTWFCTGKVARTVPVMNVPAATEFAFTRTLVTRI